MIRNVLTVAGREFRSFFDQATAYILLVVFLATNSFFYFRTILVTGEATLRPMLDLLPWLLLFFVPAATMRSLAEERATGTLELALAQPIREIEFLLGKFLGILGFLGVALAGTLGAVVALRLGAHPFAGVIVAQYVGSLMFLGALVAIGIWASSLTRNQITAFIIGVAIIFSLMAINFQVVLVGLPPVLAAAANRLGLLTHFGNIARGVIDLRDVVYFITVASAFLALAFLSLQRGKLSRKGSAYRTLWLGTVGILGICVVVNLLGRHIRGRLDLTPGKAYTLSRATRQLVGGLDDIVAVKLFASRELPPQAALVRRDIEDLLADYEAAGESLEVETFSPEGENDDRKEAERLGIPAIQFNVLGQEELQVKQGYLGIAIQYADGLETLPFIQQTQDLEYRLTSAIRKLTQPERAVLGFLTGHGEHDIASDMQGMATQLRQTYGVQAVNVTEDTAAIPDSVRVLIVPGPTSALSEAEGSKLEGFLARGGNLLLMFQKDAIDQTALFTNPQPHPVLDSLLASYGAGVTDGLVFDMRSNGRVTLPTSSGMSFVVPYPLWPVLRPAATHVTVDRLSSVMAPWASEIDITGADSAAAIPLLSTTEFGGHLTGRFPVNPQFDWNSVATDLAPRIVAAALLRSAGAETGEAARPGGRIVLVGDADFATDRIARANPENLVFFQNAVDWLAQDEDLIGIRAKNRANPPLLYSSEGLRDAAKYANIAGIPFLFVVLGTLRLIGRRRRQARPYEPPAFTSRPEAGR
ncbi:MAG: Gldg family protein [Gemmatimonadota bacterium]